MRWPPFEREAAILLARLMEPMPEAWKLLNQDLRTILASRENDPRSHWLLFLRSVAFGVCHEWRACLPAEEERLLAWLNGQFAFETSDLALDAAQQAFHERIRRQA